MNKLFSADKILFNGKILTVDAKDTIAEALAIKDGRFLATGKNDFIRELAWPDTYIMDLEGKTVLPGIIDSHTHPNNMAAQFMELNCRQPQVRGVMDIIEMVKQRARGTEPGKWIRGANFNDSKLEEKRHVSRWELDEVSPHSPVLLRSDTGHQCIVNSRAFELAGVTKDTDDPAGGKIDRDQDGEPTGLLYENAMELVTRVIPPYSIEELKPGLRKALDQFSQWGVTTTHDAGGFNNGFRAFNQLLQEGIRQVRFRLMVDLFPQRRQEVNICEALANVGIESGFGNDWLKIMTLKIYGDGSGAGGTARVYEPQNRGPKGTGLMMTDPEMIENTVMKAHESGLRCSIHSIGDKGIDIALDCIEKAQKKKPIHDMRHRLEHNSCCTPKQLERIKALGVTPSSSIGYMYGLGDQYLENFGQDRARWLHPHKTMKQMGIIAGGNSDCPITFYSPFVQIYAAVTRKSGSGQVIGPEETIDIMEAIRVYTWNGAYLSKDEDRLGSIEPGKLADLIVIDRDITSVPPEELLETEILTTIVDGNIVYEK